MFKADDIGFLIVGALSEQSPGEEIHGVCFAEVHEAEEFTQRLERQLHTRVYQVATLLKTNISTSCIEKQFAYYTIYYKYYSSSS